MAVRFPRDLRNVIAPLVDDPLVPHGSGFGLDATWFDSVLRTEGSGYDLFEIYAEIERDCHAFSVLQSRKLDVSRREWMVQPYQQRNASIRKKDQRNADMVEEMLRAVGSGQDELNGEALVQSGESGFDAWAHAALNSLLYGFSGNEIIWDGRQEVFPARLIYRKPHRFRFALVEQGYLPRLKVRNKLEESIPPRKFIFHYHQPENGPFGLGLGHRLFWPVWFKREDVKMWLLFTEKYASPTAAVEHPVNATTTEINNALQVAEAMSSQTAIAIPEGFKYALLEAQRSGTINAYKDLVDWCNDEMSKAVLGQTGTTDQSGGGGSRARDEVAERVSLRLAKHDADCLANTVNSTLIRWIMRFNGGQERELPQLWWQFPELEQRQDLNARVQVDKTLWDMEFMPTREYIEETYEIELEEEQDDDDGPTASDQLEQLFGGGTVPAETPAAAPATPEQPAADDAVGAMPESPNLSEMDAADQLDVLFGFADFAAKKKKKSTKKKNCKKGKVCGGSCIAKNKRCLKDPPSPAVGKAASAITKELQNEPQQAKEQVPDDIPDRNKDIYQSAIDNSEFNVSQKEMDASKKLTDAEGSDKKAARIRDENSAVTEAEAKALSSYIGGGYDAMSAALYNPSADNLIYSKDAVDATNKLTINAMRKLEPVTEDSINDKARQYSKKTGTPPELYNSSRGLQRGLTLDDATLNQIVKQHEDALNGDGIVRQNTWFATSTMDVANDKLPIAADSNLIYRVQPKLDGTGQGRYVDHFKNDLTEGEVLYAPYSQFKVTGVTRAKSRDQILKENNISRQDAANATHAVNANYFKQTYGKSWKSQFESIMGFKPPSDAKIKEGLELKVKLDDLMKAESDKTFIDLQEI